MENLSETLRICVMPEQRKRHDTEESEQARRRHQGLHEEKIQGGLPLIKEVRSSTAEAGGGEYR